MRSTDCTTEPKVVVFVVGSNVRFVHIGFVRLDGPPRAYRHNDSFTHALRPCPAPVPPAAAHSACTHTASEMDELVQKATHSLRVGSLSEEEEAKEKKKVRRLTELESQQIKEVVQNNVLGIFSRRARANLETLGDERFWRGITAQGKQQRGHKTCIAFTKVGPLLAPERQVAGQLSSSSSDHTSSNSRDTLFDKETKHRKKRSQFCSANGKTGAPHGHSC